MKLTLTALALKNLRRRSFRTAVLIVAIALLVATLVFGITFLSSVSSTLDRKAARLGADILVVPVGARDYAEEVLLETKTKVFYMNRSVIDRVQKIPGVAKVSHQTYLTTVFGLCCDIPPATVVAFNQNTDFIVGPWLKKSLGRKLNRAEAIIGHDALENLGLYDVTRSLLFGIDFKIVGVLDKTGTGLDNAIFMSDENIDQVISRGKAGLKPDEISLVFVKVADGFDPAEVSRAIEGEIIEADTIARNDMGKSIISSLRDIRSIFLITIILASILSTFLGWAVFSAVANERTREVGIIKAFGASGGHIVRMFTLEIVILGIAGSVIGIAFGTCLSLGCSNIFNILKDTPVNMPFSGRIMVGLSGLVAGTGICLLGALSSIVRLQRLSPHSAMKEICIIGSD